MSGAMSSLDQAHEHAGNAADYYSRGFLILAAEEHVKAADAFQSCVEQSTDEHTKNTLRKLHLHHRTWKDELNKRVAKLKEEGKDPALPQISSQSRSPIRGNEVGSSRQLASRDRLLESSTNAFDESFMVLNQQTESGEDSPFDLFWKITGDIMVNLSQPMGFQTAALAALDVVENRSAGNAKGIKSPDGDPKRIKGSEPASYPPVHLVTNDADIDGLEDDYDSLDDFCVVPLTSGKSDNTVQLKKENAQLRLKLEAMEKQLATVSQQIAQRNEHLRDNIMLARKEAQRAMAASTTLGNPSIHALSGFVNLNLNSPQTPGPRVDKEGQLLKRIRELEEEVRAVQTENDKQKAMIAKFRDRWERLKESAKKKKIAKAAGRSDAASVGERIDEDPEAEAAATADDTFRDGV